MIITPDDFKVYDYKPTYEEVREFVGGLLQLVSLPNGDHMYVDEEGLLKEFPIINMRASRLANQTIIGNVAVIPVEHQGDNEW